MESCSHSPPTNSPEQRSPSPSAVSRSLLTEQDCMPDNSPVQTHPNQRPQASSLGFPEQIACSATAGAEVSASCSRSREAAQLGKPATAGGAGTADYISTLENDVLRASLCSKTEGDNSSSKSTQSTPVSAAENAGSECNPEAAAVGIARNSNTSKSELLQPNPCKEDDVQMLDLSPSQQATPPEHRQGIFSAHPAARGVAANLVTACDVAKNIPGEDASGPLRQSVMQIVAAHSAMLTCTDSVQNAAPNSPNSSSNRNCLPTVRQNAAISILQNPAVLNSTDFAQNAVSNSSNSKNSPPTVRQNAAASSPHLSAASSKHSSHLHLQTSENLQAPQPDSHRAHAVHFKQQGNVMQQQPNSSKPPNQQPQLSPAASSVWARKEYVNFGDIDLSTSAHIREGAIQLSITRLFRICNPS